jgi:hypothetical protein
MILYHITKPEYLPKICTGGLQPLLGKGLRLLRDRDNFVYLTNDVDKIINEQLGSCWPEIAIITVEVDNVKPKQYTCGYPTPISSTFEFIIDSVPPERIINTEIKKNIFVE